ncbi:MAG: hypothetical protein JO038_06325 [Alphaproteobacteria bacterium]|nr:hypothetical protein [Alphaproteobacteria bacterium]
MGAESRGAVEAAVSAVSWAAVIGGAFVIAAVGLILLALGSGLGFAAVSPWQNSGVSARTFGVAAAVWLIVVQWVSAGFGGYVTGRLRTKWVGVHTDEVAFRDTAHGFLAWAVAAVLSAFLLSSALAALAGGAAQTAGTAVSGMAQGASQAAAQGAAGQGAGTGGGGPSAYLVDTLFRSDHPDANANPQEVKAETTRVLASGLRSGDIPSADRTYLAQLVAARTGLSQQDAEKRVDDVIAKAKDAETKARQAADEARKAASYLAFFTAFSMVVGAFIAAAAAALGGHRRDEYGARV